MITCSSHDEMYDDTFIDWLVDIGLPQYRDTFLEALVDGNILNEITYVRILLEFSIN